MKLYTLLTIAFGQSVDAQTKRCFFFIEVGGLSEIQLRAGGVANIYTNENGVVFQNGWVGG